MGESTDREDRIRKWKAYNTGNYSPWDRAKYRAAEHLPIDQPLEAGPVTREQEIAAGWGRP